MNQIRSISISAGGIIKALPVKSLGPSTIQNATTLAPDSRFDGPKLENDLAPSCQTVDNSILSVTLPPSVPIVLKPGSLVSVYGIGNKTASSITNSLIWHLNSLLHGDFNVLYSKILSTSAISMLISSNKRRWLGPIRGSNHDSISVLQFDGTTDWALLKPGNLQFIIGNSLILKHFVKPKYVSKRVTRFYKLPTSTTTGLRTLSDWFKFNWSYNLIGGRGTIGVVGQGSIYNINLVESEEILINRANLLAVSVNGSSDLSSCLIKYESQSGINSPVSSIESSEVSTTEIKTPAPTTWDNLKSFGSKTIKYFGLFQNKTANYLIGNQDFIKIIGPRNILIQSDSNYKLPELPVDSMNQNLKDFRLKANDYLNIVNLSSKDKIKSTPTLIEK